MLLDSPCQCKCLFNNRLAELDSGLSATYNWGLINGHTSGRWAVCAWSVSMEGIVSRDTSHRSLAVAALTAVDWRIE